MTPSRKTSTLSTAFILSLGSVLALIIIALFIAIFTPESYKLASEDKMLVLVLLISYVGYVNNIVGAYLGSRTPNKTPEQEQPVEVVEDDLYSNKLTAHDPENK